MIYPHIVYILVKYTKKTFDFLSFYDKSKYTNKNEAKMNKKQLMNKIATKLNQSKADAERTFDSILGLILDCLKNDEQVKIAGFGLTKLQKERLELVEIQELVNKFK